MEFPEKEQEVGQSSNRTGAVTFFILIVIIISVAFMVYAKNKNSDISMFDIKKLITEGLTSEDKSLKEKKISEISFESKDIPVFTAYKNFLIKCIKGSIICLDKEGETQWSKSVELNNPVLKTAGQYVLAADLNGRCFYIIRDKDIKWEKRIEGNIINASINEKGYVVIVKEIKGYKGAVDVFDSEGNMVFTTGRGEKYIVSAKVTPSCDYVVLNTVDTAEISANTEIEILDMKSKIVGKFKKSGNIFPAVWTLRGDNVLAVSSSEVVMAGIDGKEQWKQEFKKVYSSNVVAGKYIVLAVQEENNSGVFNGSKGVVKVMDLDGKISASYTVAGEIINVQSSEDVIAVNTGRDVVFINLKGKVLGKYLAKASIQEISIFSGSEAAILTDKNLEVIRFN